MQLDRSAPAAIRPYRHRKTYLRLVAIMVAITAFLCIVLSFMSAQTMTNNIASKQIDIHTINLDSNIQAIDALTETIEQSLLHLTLSENLIQLCFQEKENPTVFNKVMLDTASLSSHNNFIAKLFIYVPSLDVVLDDKYVAQSLSGSPYHPIIAEYLNRSSASSQIVYGTQTATLLYFEDSLVLIRDFPLSNFPESARATVFCIINQDKLFQQLSADEITVLDPSGNLLFGSFPEDSVLTRLYSETEALNPEAIKALSAEGENHFKNDSVTVFFNCSPITGWVFLHSANTTDIWLPLSQTLMDLAPRVFIVFAILIAVCFYTANIVIQPLDQSISALENSLPSLDSPQLQHQNELDFLKFFATTVNSSHSDMKNLLKSVSDDVNRRLFSELLSGTQYTLEDVTQVMADIQSRFHPDDFFVVGIIGDEVPRKDIRELLIRYCNQVPYLESQVLPTREYNAVAILAFRGDTSFIQMRLHITELESMIPANLSSGDHTIACAFGYIYRSILDLLLSYQSAQVKYAKLHQKAENRLGEESDTNGEYVAEPGSSDKFVSYTNQVFSYIQSGDLESARMLCHRVITSIRDSEIMEDYSAFFVSLADQLMKLNFLPADQIPSSKFEALIAATPASDLSQVLFDHAESILDGTVSVLRTRQEALSNRYVIAAREYVSLHYSNGDLSLNDVADSAGVSASYLSRIFRQNLNVTFTEYLNGYRIEQSIQLLKNNVPIKDIASQCGFNSVQHYIRVFKKLKDQSPGQFRDRFST